MPPRGFPQLCPGMCNALLPLPSRCTTPAVWWQQQACQEGSCGWLKARTWKPAPLHLPLLYGTVVRAVLPHKAPGALHGTCLPLRTSLVFKNFAASRDR